MHDWQFYRVQWMIEGNILNHYVLPVLTCKQVITIYIKAMSAASLQSQCVWNLKSSIAIILKPPNFYTAHLYLRPKENNMCVLSRQSLLLQSVWTLQWCSPVWPKVWCHKWTSALWLLSHCSQESGRPDGLRSHAAWLSKAVPWVLYHCVKRQEIIELSQL